MMNFTKFMRVLVTISSLGTFAAHSGTSEELRPVTPPAEQSEDTKGQEFEKLLSVYQAVSPRTSAS